MLFNKAKYLLLCWLFGTNSLFIYSIFLKVETIIPRYVILSMLAVQTGLITASTTKNIKTNKIENERELTCVLISGSNH